MAGNPSTKSVIRDQYTLIEQSFPFHNVNKQNGTHKHNYFYYHQLYQFGTETAHA